MVNNNHPSRMLEEGKVDVLQNEKVTILESLIETF